MRHYTKIPVPVKAQGSFGLRRFDIENQETDLPNKTAVCPMSVYFRNGTYGENSLP